MLQKHTDSRNGCARAVCQVKQKMLHVKKFSGRMKGLMEFKCRLLAGKKKKKKNKKSQTCFIFCQTMIHCFTQVGFVVLCLLSNVSAPGFSAGVSRHRRAARGASWGQGPLGPGDGCCFFTYQRQAPDPASSLTCMHFPTGGPDGLLMQY